MVPKIINYPIRMIHGLSICYHVLFSLFILLCFLIALILYFLKSRVIWHWFHIDCRNWNFEKQCVTKLSFLDLIIVKFKSMIALIEFHYKIPQHLYFIYISIYSYLSFNSPLLSSQSNFFPHLYRNNTFSPFYYIILIITFIFTPSKNVAQTSIETWNLEQFLKL